MVQKQDTEFAKLISNLWSEVFQRRSQADGVLSTSNSPSDIIVVEEIHREILISDSNKHIWGTGGQSPETNGVGMAGRWSEAIWA